MNRNDALKAIDDETGNRIALLYSELCDDLTAISPDANPMVRDGVMQKFNHGMIAAIDAYTIATAFVGGLAFDDPEAVPAPAGFAESDADFRERLKSTIPVGSLWRDRIDDKTGKSLDMVASYYGVVRGKPYQEKKKAS